MTPCSFFLLTNNLSEHMDFKIGHQYFFGETSGATTVTLEHLCLRNLRKGPMRLNGEKHNNFSLLIIAVRKHLLSKTLKRDGEKRTV